MSTNETLRPQFWVLRPPTNTMVPLIAVDELPPTITIRGVPRLLEAKDLTGMTMAGPAESRHRTYVVDMPNEAQTNRPSPPTTSPGLLASAFATPAYPSRSVTNPNIFHQPPKAYGISEQMPSHIKPPVTGNTVPVTSLAVPYRIDRNPGPNPLPPWQDASSVPLKAAPGVKEYCSYWLRKGECDYAQQGCLYKHEMPLDRAVLERLGHRDIPKWYREKHGLGSFQVGSGVSEEKGERMERSWRDARVRDEEERERDAYGGGRIKKRSDKIGANLGRIAKTSDKRSGMLWKEEGEKKKKREEREGVSTASSLVSGNTSPVSTKVSPVKSRGPASRSLGNIPTTNGSGSGHYQSVLAKKTDEATLSALEADKYGKDREMEELKRLRGFKVMEPKRRVHFNTPETSSGDESADFEYGARVEDSEWVEGDTEVQRAAIAKDADAAKNLRKSKFAKEE
jgi:hypothetical protein